MSRNLATILLTLLLTACMPLTPAPTAEPIATAALPQQETWTVRFIQSGGIMGMTREMEIHSDGQLKAADDRTGREAAIQLTEAELTRLQNLVNNLAYNAKSGPTKCADCFIYTLEISSGSDKPFTAEADDVSLEASGLSPLVEYLRTLMERALNTQG